MEFAFLSNTLCCIIFVFSLCLIVWSTKCAIQKPIGISRSKFGEGISSLSLWIQAALTAVQAFLQTLLLFLSHFLWLFLHTCNPRVSHKKEIKKDFGDFIYSLSFLKLVIPTFFCLILFFLILSFSFFSYLAFLYPFFSVLLIFYEQKTPTKWTSLKKTRIFLFLSRFFLSPIFFQDNIFSSLSHAISKFHLNVYSNALALWMPHCVFFRDAQNCRKISIRRIYFYTPASFFALGYSVGRRSHKFRVYTHYYSILCVVRTFGI